ncbi:MAG: hypothetical protein N4J56_006657 [Chroococcidiopsis sp. SAG 2025]|nr:hypothetical protein [Chroococcidiopsis sp. SAG 2025]
MSSGSYNYLYCTADESASELLESRGDVAQMLQCLRQLEYANSSSSSHGKLTQRA